MRVGGALGITERVFAGYREPGLWWFRVFGYGVHCKDHRRHPALFSERNGFVKVVHVGHWCFKWLTPLR